MVGGVVTHPAATTEPDMKPFDRVSAGSTYQFRANFSLHPAPQKTGHPEFMDFASSI